MGAEAAAIDRDRLMENAGPKWTCSGERNSRTRRARRHGGSGAEGRRDDGRLHRRGSWRRRAGAMFDCDIGKRFRR